MTNVKVIDNLIIISNNNKVICKKKCNKDITQLFNYLKSKDYNNIIESSYLNGYLIRDYISEIDITKEERIHELLYLITMLHIKTTHYKNYSLNDIKLFYEKTTDEILKIKKYYIDIVDKNDIYLFLKPSINLLIRNISLILISLDNSKYFLDKWYEIVKNKQRKRVVVNHNNLKLTNMLVSDHSYLINFDNYIIDYPIYDLVSLFKNNYKYIDMIDSFNDYLSKYNLFNEEKYLFLSLLLKINKLDFNENEIINTRYINNLINYLEKVSFFLEKYMKSEKQKCY